MVSRYALFLCLLAATSLLAASIGNKQIGAHCDTLDGPIVSEAQRALESGDVTPVLKWVREEDEALIRDAFAETRAVRDQGEDVRQMADQLFLETLIRIHRASEGAPYTGLKPAGSAPPIFVAADAALEQGSIDALADRLAAEVRRGIVERFERAVDRKAHAADSVVEGREYVAAYVNYMHFIEGVHACVNQSLEDEHFTPERHDNEPH